MDREIWVKQEAALLMFDYLRKHNALTPRKLRLFAADMCRENWHLLPNSNRMAVEIAELYADAKASDDDLRRANGMSDYFDHQHLAEVYMGTIVHDATSEKLRPEALSRYLRSNDIFQAERIAEIFGNPFDFHIYQRELYTQNICRFCGLDLYVNGLNPEFCEHRLKGAKGTHLFEMIAPAVTPRVRMIAQAIYDERTFENTPILADALEEDGCTCVTILEHLRKQPREHKCRHCGGLGFIQMMDQPHYTCWSCKGDRMISRMPRHTRGCWAIDLVLGFG